MAKCNGNVDYTKLKWNVPPSDSSLAIGFKEGPDATFTEDDIVMCLGDPTVYGCLLPPPNATNGVVQAAEGKAFNGYHDSSGHLDARTAVVKYEERIMHPITPEDVIITHGCDGALDLAMSALANPGQNILIPEISYRLYALTAKYLGCEVRRYALMPDKSWEIDLDHLESLVDDQTACVVVTNPHNPTGAVYSEEHLLDLLDIARRRKFIIIADEVYAHMAYEPYKFTYIAELADDVPTLSTNSISKRFYLPGWRVGWLILHDRQGALKQMREGLDSIVSMGSGVCSIVQRSLDRILNGTPQSFFDEGLSFFCNNAQMVFDAMERIPGLRPTMPQGGFYLLVGLEMDMFPAFQDDADFTDALSREEAVYCFPSSALGHDGYIRLVLTVPSPKLAEACIRVARFCARHYVS